jgi:hypothetical protein
MQKLGKLSLHHTPSVYENNLIKMVTQAAHSLLSQKFSTKRAYSKERIADFNLGEGAYS